MQCPSCASDDNKVIDSRTVARDASIRRRRECLECQTRFTTYEYIVRHPLMVVKKDGERVEYDQQKLEQSLRIACKKRPVSADALDEAVNDIRKALEDKGGTEVPSAEIGDLVMKKLKQLDKVAYIRYASVYREFQDIGQFEKEIKQLRI